MNAYFFKVFVLLMFIVNTGFSQLKINWNSSEFLFYETKKLKELPFSFDNADHDLIQQMKNIKDVGQLKKIKFPKQFDPCHFTATFYFKDNPSITDFKNILEHLNINEFYVNGKKVLTRTLITQKEAKDKAIAFEYKDMLFQSYFNDTSRIEYYDFQIYYAQTKLVYMYGQNYPKYLYEGYVAKFTELLETRTKQRESFLQRTKN